MKKKFYRDVLILSIILWAFFPIKICLTALGNWSRLTYYLRINDSSQCHWTTLGLGIVREWSDFGLSDTLFMIIITVISLGVFFVISLILIKIFYYFIGKKPHIH